MAHWFLSFSLWLWQIVFSLWLSSSLSTSCWCKLVFPSRERMIFITSCTYHKWFVRIQYKLSSWSCLLLQKTCASISDYLLQTNTKSCALTDESFLLNLGKPVQAMKWSGCLIDVCTGRFKRQYCHSHNNWGPWPSMTFSASSVDWIRVCPWPIL